MHHLKGRGLRNAQSFPSDLGVAPDGLAICELKNKKQIISPPVLIRTLDTQWWNRR